MIPAPEADASCFIDQLGTNLDNELPVAEAALAIEVLLAGYRSAATRAVVTLPLPR